MSDYEYKLEGKILFILSQIGFFLSKYNIFVSKILRKKIYSNRNNYSIIPMGVDLKHFKYMNKQNCRKKLNLSHKKNLVLFGGNYKKKIKRHSIAIKAVEILGEDYELISLYLNDFNKMPLYMNACDLLLMTSKHEGSPMMVKEAIACNLPVVSTDVGDVRYQIENIKGCYISKSDDPKVIAKYLKKCFSDLKGKIKKSPIKSLEKISLDYIVNKNIKIYNKVLKQ